MPIGVYKRTKPAWNKGKTKVDNPRMGTLWLGRKHSEETRKKMSIAHLGHVPWIKGVGHTEETRKKISESSKGRKVSEETRKKLSWANKGERSYLWKGGITSENHIIRGSIELRLWREAVFARDNWTCQKYGIRDGSFLVAHHIKNFSEFPELRTDGVYGITMKNPLVIILLLSTKVLINSIYSLVCIFISSVTCSLYLSSKRAI